MSNFNYNNNYGSSNSNSNSNTGGSFGNSLLNASNLSGNSNGVGSADRGFSLVTGFTSSNSNNGGSFGNNSSKNGSSNNLLGTLSSGNLIAGASGTASVHNSTVINTLWQSYTQSVVHQDAMLSLVEFLKVFVSTYNDVSRQLLPLTMIGGMTVEGISRNISKRFVEELSQLLTNKQQQRTTTSTSTTTFTGTNELIAYLSGCSPVGEAPLLLSALDILTRSTSAGIPLSFSRLLIVLLHRILTSTSSNSLFSSPATTATNTTTNTNGTTGTTNTTPITLSPTNYNINTSNAYNGNSTYISDYYSSNQSPIFSNNKQIASAIPPFQSINSFFYLTPLPPSMMGFGNDLSNSANFRLSWSPNLNSQMSIPPPPLYLEQQQQQQQQQQLQLLQLQQQIGFTSIMNNHGFMNEQQQQQQQNGLGGVNQELSNSFEQQLLLQQHNLPRSTNELSPAVSVSYFILKILGNILKDKSYLQEFLRSTDSISMLVETFTHQSTDPTFSPLIQGQLIRIFAQIMSSCCYSLESMDLIHEKKMIEVLLNVLGDQEKQSIKLPVAIIIELSQVIVYTVKCSSRLMVMLHDDFDANNGYSILLNTFIYIADFGSLRNKLDIINVACNLLFIPLRKELYIDQSNSQDSIYQPHNIAKTSLKVFNIFINVFSITNSEEMKTELLRCIKGIFYMSLSLEQQTAGSQESFDLINSSGEDSIGVFHKLEPFKIFFSQFENLNLSNRRLILEMMDEMLAKNQIKELEIRFYVALLECKMPSTVLLVSQHMTELLSKSKINRETLRKSGLLEILFRYLVDPHQLPFEPMLDASPDELSLCLQLIPGRHFPASSNKLFVLYRIEISLLSLLLEFCTQSNHIQSLFVESGGLRLLYKLLPDEYLIQQSLQVISTLAIGDLRIESKIITDLVEVLQLNGGATTLDSKVLTMRKNILAAMCYIFHKNYNAKSSFISAGGFTWCVSILDGISRCVNTSNMAAGNMQSNGTGSNSGGSNSKYKSKSTNNEIFFFLKVLIDTLSAVMKSNPDNQKYFREEIQFSTLSNTLGGCGYMEGVYSASLCDSLLNMAVSGSWPPSCEQHSLEEGSLLSVYSPISSFFPANSSFSSKDFSIAVANKESSNVSNKVLPSQAAFDGDGDTLPSPQLVNVHMSNALASPTRRGRSYTNDFERPTLSTTPPPIPTYTSLDLATEVRISGAPQINSTSRLPEKSSLALAQERYFHCQQCRDSLTIENPEIFKLIIRLMGGSEEQIQRMESKSSCYILKEINFLANCSLFNMKTLSSLLIDIVDYFKPLLINNTHTFGGKKEHLKPLLLELIQGLAAHNVTLQEFRKYFQLLRVKDYPIDLLNLLVKVSNRDNLPTYYAEMSKSSLECIDIPGYGERTWPPLKGFGVSFWFRFSSPVLKINKQPIYLYSMEGVIAGFRDKTCEFQILLDNGIISYRIIQSGATMEQHSFSEYFFYPDTFYHLCLTHTGMNASGTNTPQKKTHVKMYVNGCMRSQYGFTYPKTQMMSLYIRFGGSNAASPFKDYYNITNWHLGNSYIFEDLPLDKEVFYLYLLGPDHYRGLKVDIASVENIQPPMDKHTKLHPILIEHLHTPTVSHLHALHDKVLSILSAKCLRVTKAHRIMNNKSEAITHVSAHPQQSSDSLSMLKRSNSSRDMTFGSDPSRSSLSLSSTSSSVSSNSNRNTLPRRDSRAAFGEQSFTDTTQSIMSTSAMSTIASVVGGAIAPAKVNNAQQHSANYVSLLQTGLPSPLPPGVICQRGVKDQVADCGGVSVIIYLMAISQDKEFQRSSLRLLQSVVANHQQNTLDMKEIYGYQMVSHLIRKKRWPLDEGLLSILFSFVGVQSTRTSSHFINGVVENVLALKHFLLEWDIWRRASLIDQKKLFESLDKLVSGLHENHDFNIIKFRQADAFEIILKICREDDVPLEIIPLLMSILDSIKHRPPKIKDDLNLLISYLLETSPKGKPSGQTRRRKSTYLMQAISNSQTFSTDSTGSNVSTPLSTSPPTSGQSTPNAPSLHESMRISILTLLLDILSRSDHSVIEEFHSICSLESIFGLLFNETVPIRILFLKVIDLFLKVPSINSHFLKAKGFHLLGHQLLSYPLSEEIFGVLFCILFGKPYNQDISVKNYFKSISKDWELKYPGILITILTILCNCTYEAQHIVIKIIHHVFVHDQFSQLMLEQEMIHRLVDILSSNFVKRKNLLFSQSFNRNNSGSSESSTPSHIDQFQKEDSWKSEEAILLLLNEIALYGVKNQDANLLRDILVIIHLNTKMDYEYICFLQRRVMQNIITFFNENHTFVSVESLVSQFEKISILAINNLCYQEKSIAISTKNTMFGLSTPTKTFITASPDSAPQTPKSTGITGLSAAESDLSSMSEHYPFTHISSNDESNEDSDSSSYENSTHQKKKKLSYIQEWIKEANLFSNEAFITTLIIALSNKKLPQYNYNYLNPFSTQYSARSLLGKLIYQLLTAQEYSSYNVLTLSLLVGIDSANLGSVYSGLSVASLPTIPQSPISVLIAEEDFLMSLLHTTQRFLLLPEDDPLNKITTKLWYVIYQGAGSEFLKKVFDCQNWSTTDTREILSRYQSQYVESEFKKWEERHNLSKREWNLQYLDTQKYKQKIITQNLDISKSTKRLTESLLQLKAQTEKSSIAYYYQTRESKRFFHNQWKLLIKKVTHERAIWEISPSLKWKLDPTEGSHRMRVRMKRITQRSEMTHLAIPSELTKTPSNSLSNRTAKDETLHWSTSNLHGSQDSYTSFDNLMIGEKVNGSFPCANVSPFYQRNGELLIGDLNVYFVDEQLESSQKSNSLSNSSNGSGQKSRKSSISTGKHITMSYEDIIEIHKRRHVLKNSAIEIFLGSGVPHKTYLFAFNKPSDRDLVYDQIMSKPLPNRVDYAAEVQGTIIKMSITKKWQHGMISNFEYLMHLNTLAGRSFNDLTQYPIFPFILKDYESEELDLDNPETFRDLTKPMGAQDPQRLKKFVEKFNYLQETNEKPYHYGSHYSNIGSVLHFLVRLQPFSSYFIDFQGGRFDVPDRAFHSICQSWRLSSSISSSDVKELIPEFFYLPEFLINSNQFDMGVKQDGIRVEDVILPPWANGDPRLFIKRHLEALESKHVSENLHNWIDLMFGYKQQGEAAIKAFNMFFPLTYEGAVDIDTIEDQLTRDATIAQIHSYGQTPKQIFFKPHPQKSWRKSSKTIQDAVYNNPMKLNQYPMWSIRNPVGFIGISGDTPIPLTSQKILLYPDSNKYVSWGHWDQNLRICSLDTGKIISLIEVVNDDIICCDITKNGRLFVTGGTSGTIKVWKRSNSDGTFMTRKERGDNLTLWSKLYGHTDSILCVTVSQEFSVIVSGSKDHSCIIWDLNRLSYVMSLPHDNPVTCVQVSPTTNYIASAETNITGDYGALRLWSPKGDLISRVPIANDRINCMVFTSGIEGVVTNLLITGMESGKIVLWNAWNLTKIRVLSTKNPVTAVGISKDHTQLIVGDVAGTLECWSSKSFDGYSALVG